VDQTARATEPETQLYLLTSHMDGAMRPWGVFSTPDLAKEFAQESEDEDAALDGEDGAGGLVWGEVETVNGELGWRTEFDQTYSGATWVVHPLYLDAAYAQVGP